VSVSGLAEKCGSAEGAGSRTPLAPPPHHLNTLLLAIHDYDTWKNVKKHDHIARSHENESFSFSSGPSSNLFLSFSPTSFHVHSCSLFSTGMNSFALALTSAFFRAYGWSTWSTVSERCFRSCCEHFKHVSEWLKNGHCQRRVFHIRSVQD
jgi:hypothetical protein